GLLAVRLSIPDLAFAVCRHPADRPGARRHRDDLRPRRLRPGRRGDNADPDRARPPVGAQPARFAHDDRPGRAGGTVMALLLATCIGILAGSGVWLLLRPRTYQVVIGLSLCALAVNLFIFSMGRLRSGAPPVLASTTGTLADYA